MISLKYIKLFEAFDSSKVSGVISYIKNKDKFINTLKLVCNTIDFHTQNYQMIYLNTFLSKRH
jgi:hypothetical protein